MTALLEDVLAIRHASREMIRELGFLQSAYTPAELPHSEAHSLIEIDVRTGMTQQLLAERLRLDKSTTSRVVRSLVRKGWVRASSHPEDRRRTALALTVSGRKKLSEIHGKANREVQAALDLLGP